MNDDDHARGCEGRHYTCTCGYDDRWEATLARLSAENDALRAKLNTAVSYIMATIDDDPMSDMQDWACAALKTLESKNV